MDDAAGPRRFSVNSALLPKLPDDDVVSAHKPSYGSAPSETGPLLAQGTVEEATAIGKESSLLFVYSLPLTLTYLLQVWNHSSRNIPCQRLCTHWCTVVFILAGHGIRSWTHRRVIGLHDGEYHRVRSLRRPRNKYTTTLPIKPLHP